MGSVDVEPIPIEELDSTGPLLQTPFWARFKSGFGWTPYGFKITVPDLRIDGTMLCMVRSFYRIVRLGYIPHGPAFLDPDIRPGINESGTGELLTAIGAEVARLLPAPPTLLRYDLPFGDATPGQPGYPLLRSPIVVQPPDTVIVDLGKTDEELLGDMKPKTRYNVRLATRRGVTVRKAESRELPLWYKMLRETSRRDAIAIHSYRYFESLFINAERDPQVEVELLFAEVDSEPVAGNITTMNGEYGLYHFGASTERHRNLMPTYALQWEAMRRCRDRGCRTYDLGGIPPANDESHRMYGLFRMKTGFGGRILNRLGAWDYPVRPFRFRSYRYAERLRASYLLWKKRRR